MPNSRTNKNSRPENAENTESIDERLANSNNYLVGSNSTDAQEIRRDSRLRRQRKYIGDKSGDEVQDFVFTKRKIK